MNGQAHRLPLNRAGALMKFTKAEIDAVIAASPRTTVPLNKLVLSVDYQVRPGGSTSKLSIAELAASIKDSGVLQNLIVVKGLQGLFDVCAGGRRLESLNLLASSGEIPDNYPVPVLIVPADKALLASLAENVFHVPMHPADEYLAFAKLLGEGKSVEDVAAAFGVTPLVVKRRMKLASVSPKLMAQFRADEIGLDCLMALALVDDHDKQEQAWAGLQPWNRRPECLRQLLTQDEVESDRDPVARYVTLKAYEKAGGALRRDLFSDDDKKAYLLDVPLLHQLATDKLRKKARQVAAEGWKWVDVQARWVRDDYLSHGELHKTRRAPTEQEAASLDALQARMAALQDQMDALDEGDEDQADELEREVAALQVQGKAIEADLSTWPVELMKQAGCVVHVDQNGTPTVKRGLIRPDDRSDMAQAARQAGEGGVQAGMVSLPSPKTRPVHSDKLMRRLTAHRVAAVQAELIARPDVALVAITAQLAQKLFLNHGYRCHQQDPVLAITATDSQSDLRAAADDIETSPAWLRMDAERRAWADKIPQDLDAMFPWLLAQDQATVLQLLTFAVASTVTGIHGVEPSTQRTDALALALGLDMRRWWTASGASYLNHVSKGRILEVVTEAVDINAAAPLSALKKDAAVSGAEQAMAGAGWLPMCLRTGASSKPPGDEGGADHGETSDADAVVELAV
jgi:ParB family chromosome partitioning protein